LNLGINAMRRKLAGTGCAGHFHFLADRGFGNSIGINHQQPGRVVLNEKRIPAGPRESDDSTNQNRVGCSSSAFHTEREDLLGIYQDGELGWGIGRRASSNKSREHR
jgi:hypothetical protein